MALILGRSAQAKDKEKDEKKGGGIPLFSKAGAVPAGGAAAAVGGPKAFGNRLGGKGTSLVDLIKRFYRKDMAVITSALGVLFLAPIAEHFISGPSDSRVIQPGFDSKDNPFGAGSPFEPGAGGNAPGGVSWANQGKITPLNARDPGYLIIPDREDTPGAQTMPPADGKKPEESDNWKDVVKQHASAGAKAAFGATGGTRLTKALASKLNEFSAKSSGGGSGASAGKGDGFNLAAPSKMVTGKGGGETSFNLVNASPGYKGVSNRGTHGGNAYDNLKSQAAAAGNPFLNRGGAPVPGGGQMASETITHGGGPAIPGGSTGGSPPIATEGKGGPTQKENKPEQKESLAYLRQKMEMEKSIDLKWKEKEWNEFGRSKMHEEEDAKGAWQLKAAQVQANAQIQAAAIQAAGTVAAAAVKTAAGLFKGSDKNGGDKDASQEQLDKEGDDDDAPGGE